jgi:trimeric autotransporter adhesin
MQEINAMSELTALYLTANKQLTVSPAMAKLTKLTLDGTRDWDGAEFTALPSLEDLSISADGTLSNPEKLAMPKLKTLDLGKIANQSLKLSALDSLEDLSVWRGDIKEIDLSKLNAIKSLNISNFTGKIFNISRSTTLRSLSLSSKTLTVDGLKTPYQLTELSLDGMNWNSLETGGLTNLNKLSLTNMSLKKLDLSLLTHLNNLSLYRLHDLLELDLTPLINMSGSLTLSDNGIVNLTAIGFAHLSSAWFELSRFNEESRINIERQTKAHVYMFNDVQRPN